MKRQGLACLAAVAAALCACSTTDSRIKRHKAAYDASPPAVQGKIKKGVVDVGFTPEQVIMALGQPDRVYERRSQGARDQEVWVFGLPTPQFGIGFGYYSGAPVATNVALGTAVDPYAEARTRVVFENGAVITVEQAH